jgi:pimeloyl-ACP methyl ester carboxylesterase
METSVTYQGLRSARTRTARLALGEAGAVDVTYEEHDHAPPFLILHGGGGPGTVSDFAAMFAARKRVRVLAPTHPGFAGTSRPEGLASVRSLARLYLDLLERLELSDVTVIGNSIGGWIAAEMALLNNGRVSGVILIDAVGAVVPGQPIADVSKLTPEQIAALSFHRPEWRSAPPEGAPRPAPNLAALAAYAGREMADPTLLSRLSELDLPTHVIWGESDRIVDPDYGRAIASAIHGSKFTLLPAAGHLPQLEAPEQLLGAIWDLGAR